MDDNSSITACPLGEPRSVSGLEATVVMEWVEKKADNQKAVKPPPPTKKAGEPAFEHHISAVP
jgi:hypothetical protein